MVRTGTFLTVFLVSIGAHAAGGTWQEMHETSDDVRLAIGPDGVATVQHHLRYRVVAGHFKTFDLVGIAPESQLAADATFVSEKGGGEIPARVEAKAPGHARIVIDEGKGLGRGAYTVDVSYKLDLVATKMLVRDGAMWKLSWPAPPAPEGHDGARVILDVPVAPTEPRLAGDAATTLPTLRRSAERDELELVRAHVPRGEVVVWTARVDPRAFPNVAAPELRPSAAPIAERPGFLSPPLARVLVAMGFAALAGGLALLLREKQRQVRAAAELHKAVARPLVPVPGAAFAYGVVVTAALAILLWSNPVLGALLVVLGMALAAHRAPVPVARPRGPGVWKPLKALFAERAPLPTDPLDLANRRAQLVLGGVLLALAVVGIALRTHVPQIALALPLAAAALVPLFATGTRAQLAAGPNDLAARILRPVRDALAKKVDLAHVEIDTIGRVVGESLDEVRLACVPRDRTPGLRSIEVALAQSPTGGALPEVLVRYDDGSAAADRVAALRPSVVVTGRAPEEKVVRLVPEEPSVGATASLVGRLLTELEGRRAADRNEAPRVRFRGAERRRPLHRPLGQVARSSTSSCDKTAAA